MIFFHILTVFLFTPNQTALIVCSVMRVADYWNSSQIIHNNNHI